MSEIQVIEPSWAAPAGVHAAFTLRAGGVSAAPFDSLNVGVHVGDVPEAVEENRRRVREGLQLPAEPAWLQQVHGVGVADLDHDAAPSCGARPSGDAGAPRDRAPGRGVAAAEGGAAASDAAPARGAAAPGKAAPVVADAAIARRPGRVCVIQVADCIPVLLCARDGSAVAAAHAGWRGLAAGVLEATVRTLGSRGEDLCAWLGPGIGPRRFEVGDDVRAAFVEGDAQAASAFEANARGRWQCDLAALARRRLLRLGVREISGGEWCTYADAERFFSYRRDGRCGRMAALIWLG